MICGYGQNYNRTVPKRVQNTKHWWIFQYRLIAPGPTLLVCDKKMYSAMCRAGCWRCSTAFDIEGESCWPEHHFRTTLTNITAWSTLWGRGCWGMHMPFRGISWGLLRTGSVKNQQRRIFDWWSSGPMCCLGCWRCVCTGLTTKYWNGICRPSASTHSK